MEKTNERHTITSSFKNEAAYYGHLMHMFSYNFAKKYAKNKFVLDYGCGTGYGSSILANEAKFVTAIDISDEAINYATNSYQLPNLGFKTIKNFNFEDNFQKFDLIISMQVIEHVKNEKEYLKCIHNLLKPEGIFIVSTPNKKYRLFSFIQKPWNIFHLKEYTQKDLQDSLGLIFNEISILTISAKTEFVQFEINRLKKQRLISLPCTLFIYPNFIIPILLRFQSFLFNKLAYLLKCIRLKKDENQKSTVFNSNYTINDLKIGENLPFATDLIAICKKL